MYNEKELEDGIKACIKLQDEMNSIVNPDWKNAGYDWPMAILVEMSEFVEHIGWKWWKKQNMDVEQAFIELVDIFHFYLSIVIQEEHKPKAIAKSVCFYLESEYEFGSLNKEDLFYVSKKMFSLASEPYPFITSDEANDFMEYLLSAISILGKTPNDLFKTYVCKNVLNRIRQQFGYKEGTYIKIWNGLEDNEVMMDFINKDPSLINNPEKLMQVLVSYYTTEVQK